MAGSILCKRAVEQRGTEHNTRPVGSGPLMVASFEKQRQVVLRRNPAYVGERSGFDEVAVRYVPDPRTTVLFVGYCAENTVGWKLREGHPEVNIFGDPVPVRARIEMLDSFSGHADHSELIEYFHRITGPKKDIYLVHGERLRSIALQSALQEEYPDKHFTVTEMGMSVG